MQNFFKKRGGGGGDNMLYLHIFTISKSFILTLVVQKNVFWKSHSMFMKFPKLFDAWTANSFS